MRCVGSVCATAIEPLIATPASAAQIRTLNSTALLPLQRPRPRPVLNAQGGVRNDARLRDRHRRLPGGPYRASKLPVVSIGATLTRPEGLPSGASHPSQNGQTYRADHALPKPDISCASDTFSCLFFRKSKSYATLPGHEQCREMARRGRFALLFGRPARAYYTARDRLTGRLSQEKLFMPRGSR